MMTGWGSSFTLTIWCNTACLHCDAAQSTKNHQSRRIPFWMLNIYVRVCAWVRAWKTFEYDCACSSFSASVCMFKTFWNIEEARQLALKIQKGWKSIYNPNTQHQKVHSQGPRSNVEEAWGWVQSLNENKVAEWWEDTAAEKMMLTYSRLMALVVFSKGHKANSDGLETGSDGWSELERGMNRTRYRLQILNHNQPETHNNYNHNHSTRESETRTMGCHNVWWVLDIINWCWQYIIFSLLVWFWPLSARGSALLIKINYEQRLSM